MRTATVTLSLLITAAMASTAQAADPRDADELARRSAVMLEEQPSPQRGADAEVEYRIEQRIAALPQVNLSDVRVRSVRGAVTVSGSVPDARMRERIIVAAHVTQGVLVVRDELAVDASTAARGGGPRDASADEALARRAQDAVPADLDVVGRPLQYEAHDGVVTVRGQLMSYRGGREVVRRIRALPGVRAVRSELVIDEAVAQARRATWR